MPTTAHTQASVVQMVSTTVMLGPLCSAPMATATCSHVPQEPATLALTGTVMETTTASGISVMSTWWIMDMLLKAMVTAMDMLGMTTVMDMLGMTTVMDIVETMAMDVATLVTAVMDMRLVMDMLTVTDKLMVIMDREIMDMEVAGLDMVTKSDDNMQ